MSPFPAGEPERPRYINDKVSSSQKSYHGKSFFDLTGIYFVITWGFLGLRLRI